MNKIKRITAFAAALIMTAAVPCTVTADEELVYEIIPETGNVYITINTDKELNAISPLIYGITDSVSTDGISPTVLKQTGTALSTYNWENNCSNSGSSGFNSNDMSLVEGFSSDIWNTPALYTDKLIDQSDSINAASLVTLPMLGYAAKDSMGIVSNDELSRNTRWCRTEFSKNSLYLKSPDLTDDVVYIDEYVSYLVNKYGNSEDGGIKGYFLDTEPDNWHKNFSVLKIDHIKPEALVERSAQLAGSVKAIDSSAFIFGPSLSGLQACINLGNDDIWTMNGDFTGEYSWFIDYYLSEMRSKSKEYGYRLLDVLDLHYYCEAMTPMGTEILTSSDNYSNAYRMQAVRTLWDSDYTENSMTVLMNKQFTPVIPTLQASIRINYPGTRLSFSEYDFGGGDNITGAIAQIDALGTFAREDVFMACLNPVNDDYSFQTAALRLFTDYDGSGSDFGDTLVYSDNEGDNMSSVYASVDKAAPEKLYVILTNKNMINTKDMFITIQSDEYDYKPSEAYTINENADVTEIDTDFIMTSTDNGMYFNADVTSVYLLVLDGNKKADETETTPYEEVTEITDTEQTSEITTVKHETQTTVTQTLPTTTVDPADETIPDHRETVKESTPVSTATDEYKTESSSTTVSYEEVPGDRHDDTVAFPIKIIVSFMTIAAAAGIVYILVFDKK